MSPAEASRVFFRQDAFAYTCERGDPYFYANPTGRDGVTCEMPITTENIHIRSLPDITREASVWTLLSYQMKGVAAAINVSEDASVITATVRLMPVSWSNQVIRPSPPGI